MGSKRIATTNRSGLSLAQVGGNDIYKMLHQVQSVIELGQLGDDYVKLFSEPVDNGRSIDWYVDDGDKAVPVTELDAVERKALLGRFRDMLKKLKEYSGTLRSDNQSPTYRNYADIIDKALTVPGIDSLYSVDGQPVLVNWGFSAGDNDLVDSNKKLMKEVEEKLEDAAADIKKELKDSAPAAASEAAQSTEELAPETGTEQVTETADAAQTAAEQSQEIPEKAEPNPPAAEPRPAQPAPNPPAPKSSNTWLVASIVGAAILAAGGLGMWYLMNDKKAPGEEDTPSMGWLKGDLNAKGVLINENNEPVDLTLRFEGEDGKGKVLIVEKGQTCEGQVQARPQPDNRVSFAIGEVRCPNGNNYDPLSLVCARGSNECTGTNRNGESWQLNVNMQGVIK